MPYIIRKVPSKKCYRVSNKKTRRVHAKCTTLKRARKQVRLMQALDHNPNFVPNSRSK